MTKRILVPLDGSPLAERVLPHVRKLLLRQDAEVMLLHVLQRLPPADYRNAGALEAEAARRELEALQQQLAGEGARARIAFMTGDPAEEILEFAEAFQPSLIAMTTHGRTGLARAFRGSIAEQVLRHCPFPIYLANPLAFGATEPSTASTIRRILVPTDGSDASARIIPLVEDFARTYDSEILLLYVAAIYPDPMEYPVPMVLPSSEDAAEVVERFARRFDPAAGKVRTRVAFGLPSAQIVQAASLEGAELVAMATHGRTGVSRFLLGSVAEEVLRSCPCPTLILRTAEAHQLPVSRRSTAAKEA